MPRFDTSFNFGANAPKARRPKAKKPKQSAGSSSGKRSNAWTAYVGKGK